MKLKIRRVLRSDMLDALIRAERLMDQCDAGAKEALIGDGEAEADDKRILDLARDILAVTDTEERNRRTGIGYLDQLRDLCDDILNYGCMYYTDIEIEKGEHTP